MMPAVRIERIELRLVRLRLVAPFETSTERTETKECILVRLEAEGAEGWGEAVADPGPFYAAETNDTAWQIITRYLAPRLLGVPLSHARETARLLSGVRGNPMAKAGVEMAVWALHAELEGVPLGRLLGGTRESIASGVSIGIQASLDQLADAVSRELGAGYRRIKIKVRPGWDIEPVAMIRDRFGAIPLMVDANGAYSLSDADHLARLDRYGLMMIEQPLDHDDLADHASLARRLETPICLDESISGLHACRAALALGACRIVNIKPGRVGGFAESIAIHDLCASRSVPVWHGGMLETGIGRTHNIHLASLPNFSLPGDISASRRYFAEDLIDPPVEVGTDGTVGVPRGVGLGARLVASRIERATVRRETLVAG